MKRLILISSCFVILLASFACSSNSSHLEMEVTEDSEVFLPIVSEFVGEITATSGLTDQSTASVTAKPLVGVTPEQEIIFTPRPAGLATNQIPEDDSYLIPFKPFLQAPIPYDYNQEIEKTYRYGSTQNGTRIPHDGVEFYNASGTPVLSAADGIVYFAGSDNHTSFGQFKDFYGNLVIIEHDFEEFEFPVFTLYAHLSLIEVKTGDMVKLGDKIGKVGASGSAIGSHLHFEVRIGQPDLKNRVNPELYLALIHKPPETQKGILVGRIIDKQGKYILQNQLVIQLTEDGQINPNIVYYLESYAVDVPSDPKWQENFVISNLPAGYYRISTFIENQFIERYINITDNFVTDITLSGD